MDTQYKRDNVFLNLKCIPGPFYLEHCLLLSTSGWLTAPQICISLWLHVFNIFMIKIVIVIIHIGMN